MATKPPDELGKRGRAYWASTMTTYVLSDSETELLREVCRTMDSLDQLTEAIARDGVTVPGSAGQPVVNPAVTEARGQRLALHRLIAALALPDLEGGTVQTARTIRAKTGAHARWRGHVKDEETA